MPPKNSQAAQFEAAERQAAERAAQQRESNKSFGRPPIELKKRGAAVTSEMIYSLLDEEVQDYIGGA